MLICDTHCDTLYALADRPDRETDVTPEKLARGGVSLQTMALFVGGSPVHDDIMTAYRNMLLQAEKLEQNGLTKLTDPLQAQDGQPAFMLSVEGCDLLEEYPGLIEEWRRLGVRMAALTWNYDNVIGTPAVIDQQAGLKRTALSVLKELSRAGIAIDVSHLSRRGMLDVLEAGYIPLASHSCCDRLCPHPRNLTDDQLRALFAAGGYVGVNFYPAFLTADKKATVTDVVHHILHMLETGGEGMIGFGSDFDGIESKPEGLNGPQDLPVLLQALRDAGLDEHTVRGIAGENLLSYYRRLQSRF